MCSIFPRSFASDYGGALDKSGGNEALRMLEANMSFTTPERISSTQIVTTRITMVRVKDLRRLWLEREWTFIPRIPAS